MRNMELLAFVISFAVGVVLCKVLIPVLHKLNFGQQIRKEGPASHLTKYGTPTMGGIAILFAMIIGTVFFVEDINTVIVLVITFAFAIIGLLDDVLKIMKKQSEGLKAWQKLFLQLFATCALVLYVGLATEGGTETIIPFYGVVDIGGWYYPLAIVAVLGTVNGANFTDGLDGLATSVTSVICAFLFAASLMLGASLEAPALAMLGALMAFLIFNAYPAKVFMGDTGSLALGGFVAAMALIMKIPIFIIIFAFVYLAEIVSVILQVCYFKITHGKKLFKMTPIHHTFELSGWSETRVVVLFSVVTLICCGIAYVGLAVI